MTKLVSVCRDDEKTEVTDIFKEHQLPIYVEDMRTMIVQFDDPSTLFNPISSSATSSSSEKSCSRALNYRQFCQKIARFTDQVELFESLCVKQEDFNAVLPQLIPCVGCRHSIEKLYNELAAMNHPAIFPFVVNENSTFSLHRSFLTDPRALHKLLIVNGAKVKVILENLIKCRRNKRCNLHSLDVHVPKSKTRWEDLWPLMSEDCADECCVVETEHLLEMLESYLQKHKFCTDCRTKIMKAYHLLTGEADKTKEPGYNANLYQGLRYCSTECHLHLRPCAAYLNMLMDRAEPELVGGFKERHAKTLEIAQGEVLTCIGLYVYDRLHRLSMAMKTLQNTFQLLYCSGIAIMSTAFQKSLESKGGLSTDSLEKICAELQDSAVKPSVPNNHMKKIGKKSKTKTSNLKEIKKVTETAVEADLCRQCLQKATSAQTRRQYHLSRSLSPVAVVESRRGDLRHSSGRGRRISSSDKTTVATARKDSANVMTTEVGLHGSSNECCNNGHLQIRPPTVNGDERYCSNKSCRFNGGRGDSEDRSTTSISSSSPSPAKKPADPLAETIQNSTNLSEDIGYLSSVTNPTDRKSTISSDALSIGSDRSETIDPLSESSPVSTIVAKYFPSPCPKASDFFYTGSLTEMLKLSDEAYSCRDDGIDSFDENDDGFGITKEDIEWFNRNRSVICQERQQLRARLLQKFETMQIRLGASK